MNHNTECTLDQRQFWPDLLRIVAAFAVVFLHVAAERISPIDASHPEWWAVVVCRVLPSFAVPVFFMLYAFRHVPARS